MVQTTPCFYIEITDSQSPYLVFDAVVSCDRVEGKYYVLGKPIANLNPIMGVGCFSMENGRYSHCAIKTLKPLYGPVFFVETVNDKQYFVFDDGPKNPYSYIVDDFQGKQCLNLETKKFSKWSTPMYNVSSIKMINGVQ